MKGHTHILGGLAAGLALATVTGHAIPLAAAAGFGGLIPDWDHPHSTLGRWIPWPTVERPRGPQLPPAVGRVGFPHPIWHRHQAHSLVGSALAVGVTLLLVAGVAGVLHAVLPWRWIALGLYAGCLSHLALDACNQTPQWWLWPLSRRGFRWPWHAPVARIDGLASLLLTGIDVWLLWAWVGRGHL